MRLFTSYLISAAVISSSSPKTLDVNPKLIFLNRMTVHDTASLDVTLRSGYHPGNSSSQRTDNSRP
jgi:hypothetical protein